MFSYTVGIWPIQSPVPSHAASVGHRPPVMAWVSSHIKYWLATPISSVPLLLQHIMQGGQVIGRGFHVWAGSKFPSLYPLVLARLECGGKGFKPTSARPLYVQVNIES